MLRTFEANSLLYEEQVHFTIKAHVDANEGKSVANDVDERPTSPSMKNIFISITKFSCLCRICKCFDVKIMPRNPMSQSAEHYHRME